jgi:hypothetical protein
MSPQESNQTCLSNFAGVETIVPPVRPRELTKIALLLAGIVVVSLAGLLGGMQYLIVGLALGLAILILRKPDEAVPSAWLFMLAAMILLPSEARLRFIDLKYDQVWQMYFWAAGSLIVALAGLYSVGISSALRAPAAVKAFFVIALASSVYGFVEGNAPSYVIRQLYGSILFVFYFIIAWAAGDEDLLFRRMKAYGAVLALALFVYYASVFSQFGFHKEDTSITTQMGLIASFLFAKGLVEKRTSWFVASSIVFGASLLFFMRHVLLTFLFAVAISLAVRSARRIQRIFYFLIAALILLPSIFPFGAQVVLDQLEKLPAIYTLLPQGTTDTTSLVSRNLELVTAAGTLLKSPILGAGMGSQLAWEDPAMGSIEQAYVDNGWAYVMLKMGCLGILTFCWLLFTILRATSHQSLAVSISLLAILLIAMFSEPICFQFTTSPIAGALLGLLYAQKYPRRSFHLAPSTKFSSAHDFKSA